VKFNALHRLDRLACDICWFHISMDFIVLIALLSQTLDTLDIT